MGEPPVCECCGLPMTWKAENRPGKGRSKWKCRTVARAQWRKAWHLKYDRSLFRNGRLLKDRRRHALYAQAKRHARVD